jgi:Transposase DDE domain
MHKKLKANQQYTNAIVRKRSSTVEPVLGTLINFLNMKKINSRGMTQANKHVLMAALTYNLKKLLKFDRKKPTIKAQEMPKMTENILDTLKTLKYDLHILLLGLANFGFLQVRKISIAP